LRPSSAPPLRGEPRVSVRFAERDVEDALRALHNAAETLDRKAGGPISSALFPNGRVAEIKPRAAAQVDAVRRVMDASLRARSQNRSARSTRRS
jgi:hypothetical protein